jgi:hypothetical protein
MTSEVGRWIQEVSRPGFQWFVKYLAGNDTLLTGAHQAGPYVPKPIAFGLFPSIAAPDLPNPRVSFDAVIDSHGANATPSMIWYNQKTRNECRMTGWGGRTSPVLDPDSTGSLCVFAFMRKTDKDAEACRIWLCRSIAEEDEILETVGPVEPGGGIYFHAGTADVVPGEIVLKDSPCRLLPREIPNAWRIEFPAPAEVIARAIAKIPSARHKPSDVRLLDRRKCEFEVFQSIEEAVVLPRIREGFDTVGLFVDFANSVTNRRKHRSGASLELHAKMIFDEEELQYSWNEVSEERKRPDFLFPSAEAYRRSAFPANRLRMLAVKTTCKDRWRQILQEADRIPVKHLLTLQEGISANQLDEMERAGVKLVVPKSLHTSFPREYREHLESLEDFIRDTRLLSPS